MITPCVPITRVLADRFSPAAPAHERRLRDQLAGANRRALVLEMRLEQLQRTHLDAAVLSELRDLLAFSGGKAARLLQRVRARAEHLETHAGGVLDPPPPPRLRRTPRLPQRLAAAAEQAADQTADLFSAAATEIAHLYTELDQVEAELAQSAADLGHAHGHGARLLLENISLRHRLDQLWQAVRELRLPMDVPPGGGS